MAHVTIVDDDQLILRTLRPCLEADGHVVDVYDDPLVALPKMILVPPAVLVLNGRMPGMHGIDFFLKFREFSKAPVIFLSANVEEIEDELLARAAYADGFVGKPFSPTHILRMVNRLAGRSHRSPS